MRAQGQECMKHESSGTGVHKAMRAQGQECIKLRAQGLECIKH